MKRGVLVLRNDISERKQRLPKESANDVPSALPFLQRERERVTERKSHNLEALVMFPSPDPDKDRGPFK